MSLAGVDILNDPTYRIFAWWTAVMVLKIILMVPLIGRYRFGKKIFISPEDTSLIPGAKVVYNDPDIERIRRAHLNDLESILPWIMSTMLWLTTSPEPEFAATLIKTFGICRLLHTFVYAICPIPQPARFLAYVGGYLIMFLHNGTETSKEFTALYSWWASLLLLQLMSFTWFTGRIRVRTETIHSEEDRMWLKNRNVKLHPSGGGHPELDYIRSGHLHDLSIILLYLIISMIWLNTSPSAVSANVLLRAFPIAKIIDTAMYSKFVDTPKIYRGICLAVAYSIIVYMIVSCILCLSV